MQDQFLDPKRDGSATRQATTLIHAQPVSHGFRYETAWGCSLLNLRKLVLFGCRPRWRNELLLVQLHFDLEWHMCSVEYFTFAPS